MSMTPDSARYFSSVAARVGSIFALDIFPKPSAMLRSPKPTCVRKWSLPMSAPGRVSCLPGLAGLVQRSARNRWLA